MKYREIVEGRFISRPNRFIAKVEINGEPETVHVKNTGRCKELLVPDCTVYLERSPNPSRKTKYDLVAVYKQVMGKEPILINMDSQAPNTAAFEWIAGGLFSPDAIVKREVTYKSSRFDLFVTDGQRKAFIEVKGVTLENNGVAMFPDAPTERGVKHIRELIECLKEGYEAYILFVIQMKGVNLFKPNDITHKAFGDALREAAKEGVHILAVDCNINPNEMKIDSFIDIEL